MDIEPEKNLFKYVGLSPFPVVTRMKITYWVRGFRTKPQSIWRLSWTINSITKMCFSRNLGEPLRSSFPSKWCFSTTAFWHISKLQKQTKCKMVQLKRKPCYVHRLGCLYIVLSQHNTAIYWKHPGTKRKHTQIISYKNRPREEGHTLPGDIRVAVSSR